MARSLAPFAVVALALAAGCGGVAGSDAGVGAADASDAGSSPGSDADGPGRATEVSPDAEAGPTPGADSGSDSPGDADGTDGAADGAPVLIPYRALAVAMGDTYACALRDDHSVLCWGANPPAVEAPAGRTVSQLAAGGHQACAILDDGGLTCWALDVNSSTTTARSIDLPRAAAPRSSR